MASFYVLNYGINKNKVEPYDVIPYLVNCYTELKKKRRRYRPLPETFEEFREFVKDEGMYMWWSRCEYEIIIKDWPCGKYEEKWDVWGQVKMNLDLVTKCLMESIPKPRKRKVKVENEK